jgi:hypothetical protein
MNLDRFLAILGLLVGLISVPLAYYFYRKTIRTKLLAYAYTKPVSLQLPVYDVPSEYLRDANEPSRVFMLLWNRGTAPIEKSDFVHPIKILPTERVLRIVTHEQDGAVATTVDEAEKSISIDLLRPGEATIFLIDAIDPDYRPEISVVMKSAEMSVFLPSAPIEPRDMISITAAAAVYVLLLGIGAWSVLKLAGTFDLLPQKVEETPFRQVLVLAFATVAIPIFFYRVARWVHKRTHESLWWLTPFLPYKFFELQKACSKINDTWAGLRKESRGLMAAG